MTADWSLAIWFHSRIAAKPPQPRAQARGWEFQRLPSAECQSKTTGSRPWLKLFRRSAAEKCAETATTLMLVSVIGLCRRRIIALQKCSDLLFLSQLIRRLWIELLHLLQLFSRDRR